MRMVILTLHVTVFTMAKVLLPVGQCSSSKGQNNIDCAICNPLNFRWISHNDFTKNAYIYMQYYPRRNLAIANRALLLYGGLRASIQEQ